jgi:hypothetical protein
MWHNGFIMNQTCTKCNTSFEINETDQGFYKKMGVPIPQICPECRFKLKVLWRNEITLYSGVNCDLCSKGIITMYNPKSPYKIYCYSCFYSEKWDPKSYATDYDFSRPFFEQLKEFIIRVPKIATYISKGDGENINSEYVNMASGCKDCYLVFNTSPAEETMYSRGLKHVKDSSDLYFGTSIERCYEGINLQQSSGIVWGQNVIGSVDSHFILNGSGLMNCFGCVNLRNKGYHWFNEELSKEEYTKKLSGVLGSYSKMVEARKQFEDFSLKFPRKENNDLKTVNSTGDYLFECKNVYDSFEISKSEDSHYLFSSKEVKDSIGTIGYGTRSERLLEVVATGLSSNVIGTYGAENSSDILYSFYIANCQNCIGCDALKNGKYAIFNKEYSKEEYEKIKAHIVKELTDLGIHGLMMPPELAPFAYNETIGQDNFPMTKEEVLAAGFRWEDDIQMTKGKETLLPEDIPDHIRDVPDTIINEILKCVFCERNYKIIPQELDFYKKMVLPIPRKCFYCRHRNRIVRRGPYKFWNRNCAKCEKGITTNYAPERPEIVYCEQCYQQEVI